ncbi:hypothetical protein L208DRAFT_1247003 [Tricholoma matsutake]|nr:hypothetical protein L208DRAFT_1247003 [Tricholoma matsutake 945]
MIPAIEGLLPEPHNCKLTTLLFRLAEWHTLAKLWMHTELTLSHLHQSTGVIGKELRVIERPPGGAAGQNKSVIQSTSTSTALGQKSEALSHLNASASSRAKPKAKLFSLLTYKLHALGDYMWTIQLFGTTDSYSTQIVRSQLYSEGAD